MKLEIKESAKQKQPALNYDEVRVASYIEQIYWEKGEIPSQEIIATKLRLPIATVIAAWKKELFRRSLLARGLDLESVNTDVLTPMQITLANMLINIHDKSSVRQLLEPMGITTTQYNAWLRDPTFQKYLRTRIEKLFAASDFEAYKSLLKSVQDGDVAATKFFFELRGIYNPRVQVDIDIRSVMVKVVDVIARNVNDPQVIEAISKELGSIGEDES